MLAQVWSALDIKHAESEHSNINKVDKQRKNNVGLR